jgi:predicted ABC-type ATPase
LNPIDFREFPLLDPDVIGKILQTTLPGTFPIAAARQVLTSAREHIRNSKSFAIETSRLTLPESEIEFSSAATMSRRKMCGDATSEASPIFP